MSRVAVAERGERREPSPEPLPGQRTLPRGGVVLVVAVAMALLSAWVIGPPAGRMAKVEKRSMTAFPKMDAAALADPATYAQLEAALKDRVRLRPIAVETIGRSALQLNGSSNDQVVVGPPYQDPATGRHTGPELYYYDDFVRDCGNLDLTMANVTASIRELRDLAQRAGIRLLIVVPPDKGTVLPDLGLLGAGLRACRNRQSHAIHQLAVEFPDVLHLVDPADVLAMAPAQPFWEGDSHWTPRAGITLTELVIGWLTGRSPADASSVVMSGLRAGAPIASGDLYSLLGWTQTTDAPSWVPVAGHEPSWSPLPGAPWWPSGVSWQSPAPLVGVPAQTLLIHDSFVQVPRLQDQVASFLPSGDLVHWDAAQRLPEVGRADVVVIETTERLVLRRFLNVDENTAYLGVRDYFRRLAGG